MLVSDGSSDVCSSDLVDSFLGHGAEVLAVADAVVSAVRDDMPESETISGRSRNALADASGNYVALDLGDGRHAFSEHLEPGSIRVPPGQRVRRGEGLAALGLTGDPPGKLGTESGRGEVGR